MTSRLFAPNRWEARHCDQRPSSPGQPPKYTAKTSTAEVESIYDGEALAVLVIIRYGQESDHGWEGEFLTDLDE